MRTKKNQKQPSIEEYVATYCQEKRIRERYAVYVTPETHHRLRIIAGLFRSQYYTTTSSLADAILSHHFEEYRELLEQKRQEEADKFLAAFNKVGQRGGEGSDKSDESDG